MICGHCYLAGLGGRWIVWLGLGLGLGWGLAVGRGEVAGAADPDQATRRDAVVRAVEKAIPCVVNVSTEEVVPLQDPMENLFREFFGPYYGEQGGGTQYSVGSGVVVDEEGYIVTNFHVVNRARRIWVRFHDGAEYEAEKITGTPFTDVALLKVKTDAEKRFPAMRLAGDDDLYLGETVVALGNPFGLGVSVSRGILSSKSRRPPRQAAVLDVMDWLQTDAAINPGNSGGPLINLAGELIGINVAVYREGQGIGFALPVKLLKQALAEIYSPEWLGRLWFGARLRPGELPLSVTSVEPDSPAEQAGLKVGDRILRVDGESPASFFDLERRLLTVGAERDIWLQVARGDEQSRLALRLVAEEAYFNEKLIRQRLGASVQELTPDLARAMGLGGVRGLLIAGVDPDSPAASARLGQGMVITRVAGRAATEVVTAARILHASQPGQKVRLDLVVPRRRGFFYLLEEVAVEVTLGEVP